MCFNKKSYSSRESGNVFFFIILGIVLFGALSYTVVNTSDGGSTSLLSENKAKLSQGEIDSYSADMRAGLTQLQLEGCSSIDYTPPADQVAGDKSCHLFHPDGGGVAYRDFGDTCVSEVLLKALAIGEKCGALIYAGESGGNRLYTTAADLGQFSWNNGSTNFIVTGAVNINNGIINTNTLVALANSEAPYSAAQACRSLGADWYLPSRSELNVLYANRAAVGGFNLTGVNPGGWYYSSTEHSITAAFAQRFSDGVVGSATRNQPFSVRCIRRG